MGLFTTAAWQRSFVIVAGVSLIVRPAWNWFARSVAISFTVVFLSATGEPARCFVPFVTPIFLQNAFELEVVAERELEGSRSIELVDRFELLEIRVGRQITGLIQGGTVATGRTARIVLVC